MTIAFGAKDEAAVEK